MKTYINTVTGEIFTEEEIRAEYEKFKWDAYPEGNAPEFEEYLDDQIASGRQGDGLRTIWYAVMKDREDDDWGTGSYNIDEAKRMCVDLGPDAYIAVIDEAPNPVCIEEIEQDAF